MSSSTMPERADAGRREIFEHRRAEPAGADHQHPRALQPLLAGAADLRQHDVARIAFQLFRRERRRLVFRHRLKHSGLGRPLSAPVRLTVPCDTVRNCARPCRLENSAASVPVMKVWQLRSSRIENKRRAAARIEMRGDLRRAAGSAPCPAISRGQPRMRQDDARPAAPSARRSSRVRPACPSAEWRTRRSARCGPSSVRPAARSRVAAGGKRRAQQVSSTSTAGALADVPFERAVERDRRPAETGRRPAAWRSSPASSRTSSLRAAAIATPVSAICASIASNQAAVARILGEQAVAAAHRLFVVERALAMVGIDRQHQPVEEAAAVAGRPGEQRVHRRRHPDHAQRFRACPRPSARWRR